MVEVLPSGPASDSSHFLRVERYHTIRCTGLHLDDRRSQARAKTASRGHMLLYIPIRITLLWNVRKCVVSASASSQAHTSPWHRSGPFLLEVLCPQVFPSTTKQKPLDPVEPSPTHPSLPPEALWLSQFPGTQMAVPASQATPHPMPIGREITFPKIFSHSQPSSSTFLPPVILLLK